MFSRMIRGLLAAAVLTVAAASASIAQAPMGPAMTAITPLGEILVGPNGMTLYTFDNDTAGVSNCYDNCAVNWPPFYAEAGAMVEGNWSIVTRTDGTLIWAHDGLPLYYFINDAVAGDTNGNQPEGRWHVVVIPAM